MNNKEYLGEAVSHGQQYWCRKRGLWHTLMCSNVKFYSDGIIQFESDGNFRPDWRNRVHHYLAITIDKVRHLPHKYVDPNTGDTILDAWFADQTHMFAIDLKHQMLVSAETYHYGAMGTSDHGGLRYEDSNATPVNQLKIKLRKPDIKALRGAMRHCESLRQTCIAKVDLAPMEFKDHASEMEMQRVLLDPSTLDAEDNRTNGIVGAIGRNHSRCVRILKNATDIRWEVPYLKVVKS